MWSVRKEMAVFTKQNLLFNIVKIGSFKWWHLFEKYLLLPRSKISAFFPKNKLPKSQYDRCAIWHFHCFSWGGKFSFAKNVGPIFVQLKNLIESEENILVRKKSISRNIDLHLFELFLKAHKMNKSRASFKSLLRKWCERRLND